MAGLEVVLVEDNRGDARLIEVELEEAAAGSIGLHWFDDLDAALERLGAEGADLILLDLSLPGSNGIDTVTRVLEGAPDVPIVVLTGLDDELTALAALQRGAQDYLVKGRIEGEALVRAIRYAVERARTMAELKASEARFRTLIEHNADGIALVDGDDRVVFVNPAAEELFGHPADALEGTRFPHEVAPQATVELELVHPDGEVRTVDLRAEAVEWEGAPALLVAMHDVTRQRAAEREVEQLREQLAMSETLSALGALVAGMALEIRASTTTITNVLYQMRQRIEQEARSNPELVPVVEAFSDHSVEALDGVSRIDRFVQDLRRFTKGRGESRAPVSLDEALAPAVELFSRSRRHHIQVDARLAPTPLLELNELQLQQVVLALMTNSAEAMPGGGRIQVTVRPVDGGAELVVEDEGAGISPYVRERLWEPFFTTKPDSTGLGLPIAKRIVEAHGGTLVHEEPEHGHGARFVAFLPTTRS